jgi:small subunit ribosomal protein S21
MSDNQSEQGAGSNADSTLADYPRVQPQTIEKPKSGALEVHVDNSVERAMKILKRKLIKEGLFKELKSRRYYEKPSQRRKRKLKESMKKLRKEEARRRKNQMLF